MLLLIPLNCGSQRISHTGCNQLYTRTQGQGRDVTGSISEMASALVSRLTEKPSYKEEANWLINILLKSVRAAASV
jgi:hypothetical protein